MGENKMIKFPDFEEVISKVPIMRLIPYIYKAWDSLDEETKEKYAAVALKAAMKAMENYSNKQ